MSVGNGERAGMNGLEILGLDSSVVPGEASNTARRRSLKDFAATRGHSFQQDDIGNIYITRSGLDKTQCAIALAFDVDTSSSISLLSGALKAFVDLEHSITACDVTLLGWSSSGGHPVGRRVWDGTLSRSVAYDQAPELKAFLGLPDVETFDLAAVVQIEEDENETLVARGSPALTEKVRKIVRGKLKFEGCETEMVSVPSVSLRGKDAVAVGKGLVEVYSRYVIGLFENFD